MGDGRVESEPAQHPRRGQRKCHFETMADVMDGHRTRLSVSTVNQPRFGAPALEPVARRAQCAWVAHREDRRRRFSTPAGPNALAGYWLPQGGTRSVRRAVT